MAFTPVHILNTAPGADTLKAAADKINTDLDAIALELTEIEESNTGDETAATLGTKTASASAKSSPADADILPLSDTEASGMLKALSWSNLKATLKTYFDALYTLANLGGVPATREVNSRALSSDVTVEHADLPDRGTNTHSEIDTALSSGGGIPGTAAKATVLATARNINGVRFDGGADIFLYPPGYYYRDQPWGAKPVSVAADRYKLLSPNVENLDCAGIPLLRATQVTLDLSQAATWDTQSPTDGTVAVNRAGKNCYVYECQPVSGTVPVTLVSFNSSAPYGYTTSNSRLIGGFHCLCASILQSALTGWAAATVMAVGQTIKAVATQDGYWYRVTAIASDYKTGATEPNWSSIAVGATIVDNNVTFTKTLHSLNNYVVGDALPATVWDLKFRPICSPAGMYYNSATGLWEDIYYQSGTGTATASAFGGTITVSRHYTDYIADLASVGKKMLGFHSYASGGIGSNRYSAVNGGGYISTSGGHSDSYGRRMVSSLGAEDLNGGMLHALADVYSTAFNYAGGVSGGLADLVITGTGTTLTQANSNISTRGCASCKTNI